MSFSKRTLRSIVLGLVIASLPMLVVASHGIFTDVPDSLNSHDQIYNIYGAGLTSGDTATTYAPTKTVNRGQMASFLNRGLGRVAYSGNGAQVELETSDDLGTVTITGGGVVADKTNFIKADASWTVGCEEAGGCTILVSITDGTNFSRIATVNLADGESESGSLTWVTTVTLPADTVLTLKADSGVTAPNAAAAGELTATYVPFGPDGGNDLTWTDPTP